MAIPNNRTVVVLGSDGYTGWPITCRLLSEGYDVIGIDDLSGRRYRGESVVPIASHEERREAAEEAFPGDYEWWAVDVTTDGLHPVLSGYEFDAVVNVAQIPSAPYSMESYENAWRTQENNIRGSLNLYWTLRDLDRTETHVVQLATMGEYGQPPYPIPEGFDDDGRPAPKEPGSLYHSSKVATTVNSLFLSRTWVVPTTEVYQGIIYGISTEATDADPDLRTRFDVDEAFGTVLNRFTGQAATDHALTVYGAGGQKRAMLSLQDCVNCIALLVENPPDPSSESPAYSYPYRAVNQFDGSHRVRDLADMVNEETGAYVSHVENPREEDETDHYYDPVREVLPALGYEPTRSIEEEFRRTYEAVEDHADRIDPETLFPETEWV